jgi:hypothetical protein
MSPARVLEIYQEELSRLDGADGALRYAWQGARTRVQEETGADWAQVELYVMGAGVSETGIGLSGLAPAQGGVS